MLKYDILHNKPTIDINGEEGLDLLTKSLNFVDGAQQGNFLQVNEYYVARPDLISLAVYGDDKYADIICKLNGISNPFELNEKMVLFIPTLEYMNFIINKETAKKTNKIVEEDTISANLKVGAQKQKNEKRSPSEQVIGDTNFIVDKSLGVVFY